MPVDFAEVEAAAKRGDREFVKNNLDPSHFTESAVRWAVNACSTDLHSYVRRLGAVILVECSFALNRAEIRMMELVILVDADPFVRYYAAMALYLRKHRPPLVVMKMEEATHSSVIGKRARQIFAME